MYIAATSLSVRVWSVIGADINGNVRALSYALSHPLVFAVSSTQASQRKQQFQPVSQVRRCSFIYC